MPRGIRATTALFEDRLLDWVLEGDFNNVQAHLNVANKLFAKRTAALTAQVKSSPSPQPVLAQGNQGSQGDQGSTQRKKPGPPPGTHRKKSFSATEPITPNNPPPAPAPDPESEFAFAGFDDNVDHGSNDQR